MSIKKLKAAFVLSFILTLATQLRAQDTLVPLSVNPELLLDKNIEEANKQNTQAKMQSGITLPFFDDFSNNSVFPNTSKWVNSTSVHIGKGLMIAPKSIGAATLDGLKANGYPYSIAATTGSNPSDTLTSVLIDLHQHPNLVDTIKSVDSVFLSFFYQPEGNGDAPETNDKLILEFKNRLGNWTQVWTKNGSNPLPSDSTVYFQNIHIASSSYLHPNFQFRFRNLGTGSGAVDMWHIDYVYLNFNRGKYDSLYQDQALVYEPKSALKYYSAMPHKHFLATDMADSLRVYARNNENPAQISKNVTVFDNTGAVVSNFTNGAINMNNYFNGGLVSYASPVNQLSIYSTSPFNAEDTASFTIKHYLQTSTDKEKTNDTASFVQQFKNYFAYDDGSAEAAYGVTAFQGKTAVRIDVRASDSLQAVDIFFNPIIGGNLIVNSDFRLALWADAGGFPGTLVYKDSSAFPVYSTLGRDMFHRYHLTSPQPLNPGTYYVGFIQTTNQQLNIGFDKNNNNQSRMFFNNGTAWANASFKGSYLMRPIVGSTAMAASVQSYSSNAKMVEIKVYPNPANDKLYYDVKGLSNSQDVEDIEVQLFSTLGNLVGTHRIYEAGSIDLSNYAEGMYFANFVINGKVIANKKIIISH